MPTGDDEIERARLDRDRLYTKLLACPRVDISGVMRPMSCAGGQLFGDKHWTLTFSLDAWRFNGTRIETRPLTVLRRVSKDELDVYVKRLQPLEIVHLRARFRRLPTDDSFNAILEEIVGPSDDAELAVAAKELKTPVTHTDPQLGTFTLDRRSRSFNAKARWMGREIEVVAYVETVQELTKALSTLHELWSVQAAWDRRAKDFAASKLLTVKNTAWLDDEETAIEAAGFTSRMELEMITVSGSDTFTFWFADGDLFWGHSIEVSGTLAKGPIRADIAG